MIYIFTKSRVQLSDVEIERWFVNDELDDDDNRINSLEIFDELFKILLLASFIPSNG